MSRVSLACVRADERSFTLRRVALCTAVMASLVVGLALVSCVAENGRLATQTSVSVVPVTSTPGVLVATVVIEIAVEVPGAITTPASSVEDGDAVRQSQLSPEVPFTYLSTGFEHNCALREDGKAMCWGDNGSGQSSPPENETFIDISPGGDHTCGIRKDGTITCWGFQSEDDLPVFMTQRYIDQILVPPDIKATAISAYDDYTCAVTRDGDLECWGLDFLILDLGDEHPKEKFADISMDYGYICGIQHDGYPLCWSSHTQEKVHPPNEKVVKISTGRDHACALREDGTAICWGEDTRGKASPPEDQKFVDIAAGFRNSCGLLEDGSLVCWGSVSTAPHEDDRFTAIDGGDGFMCGILQNGAIDCWGLNSLGQARPPLATPIPESALLGECKPGLLMPRGSKCTLPEAFNDTAFEVTATGKGLFHNFLGKTDEYIGSINQRLPKNKTHSSIALRGDKAIDLYFNAVRNADNSWTIENVYAIEREDGEDLSLP